MPNIVELNASHNDAREFNLYFEEEDGGAQQQTGRNPKAKEFFNCAVLNLEGNKLEWFPKARK